MLNSVGENRTTPLLYLCVIVSDKRSNIGWDISKINEEVCAEDISGVLHWKSNIYGKNWIYIFCVTFLEVRDTSEY